MIDSYTLEHETLPEIRRQIEAIAGPSTTLDRATATAIQNALYSVLALVHELADRQVSAPGSHA